MQWLTTIAVIVGILAGLAGVVWPIVNYFSQRRHKDELVVISLGYAIDTQDGMDKVMLEVKAANPGPRPILLEDGGFQVGSGVQWSFRNWETALTLPRKLEETETYVFRVRAKQVLELLRSTEHLRRDKTRVYFRDSLGRTHTSPFDTVWAIYKHSLISFDDRPHDDYSA